MAGEREFCGASRIAIPVMNEELNKWRDFLPGGDKEAYIAKGYEGQEVSSTSSS